MRIYELVGIGGTIALVATLYAQIRRIVSFIFSSVVTTNKCDTGLARVVLSYLYATTKVTDLGTKRYGSTWAFVRPLDRVRRIVVKVFRTTANVFWFGRWPIWTMYGPSDKESTSGTSFSFIRGTVNWEELLISATDWEDDEHHRTEGKAVRYNINRFFGDASNTFNEGRSRGRGKVSNTPADDSDEFIENIDKTQAMIPLRWDMEELGPQKKPAALDELSLSSELVDLVREIRFWHDQEKWYEERGIPWRRGYLFYGEPGTGKTSLARAIAQDLDMPISIFDLASMGNEEFIRAWNQTLQNTPCIVLIEDIDSIFHGRENVTPNKEWGITFDCILNCLDGVERPNGLLVIITTNNVELLDSALGIPDDSGRSSRPGRVDKAVLFKPLDEAGRRKIAARIINDPTEEEVLVREGILDSAAQFQERCIQVALRRKFMGFENGDRKSHV